MSYSIGMMIEKIIFKKNSKNDCPELGKLEDLKVKLLNFDSLKRPSIEEALEIIKSIKYVGKNVDFLPYMNQLKYKIL